MISVDMVMIRGIPVGWRYLQERRKFTAKITQFIRQLASRLLNLTLAKECLKIIDNRTGSLVAEITIRESFNKLPIRCICKFTVAL